MTGTATHTSLLYDGDRHYAVEAAGFLRRGLERGDRALVMAPSGRVDLLRAELGRDADEVTYVDDSIAYAPQWNAYRTLLGFAAEAPGTRSCVIAEQSLGERVPAELVDYRRLEAAINLVFAEQPVDLLCPYDTSVLAPGLLDIALESHGGVLADGQVSTNDRFDDPAALLTGLATVTAPPALAPTLTTMSVADLAQARHAVRSLGAGLGLDQDVVADLALAVTEVLTNALLHGAPPADLHVYDAGPTWVCHVHDRGPGPVDPLVGLLPPALPADHGYGLWLARQLCAAVDVGSDASGTHVRLHVRTPS
jgi:anti-sigma regulatory factor (Ser/Thr protein kinase)